MQSARKTTEKRERLKNGLIILTILGTSLFVGQFSFVFTPITYLLNQFRQPEFERNRRLWESWEITHYDITVKPISPMILLCPTATLEFQDNRFVGFEPIEPDGPEPDPFGNCADYYQYQSIERLFDIVSEVLYGDTLFNSRTIELEYDDRYGFPTLIRVTGQMSEQPHFIILDFEALD